MDVSTLKPAMASTCRYPLSVLPELIVMFAMITPTLLARIALFWPRPPAAGRDLQKNTTEDV